MFACRLCVFWLFAVACCCEIVVAINWHCPCLVVAVCVAACLFIVFGCVGECVSLPFFVRCVL